MFNMFIVTLILIVENRAFAERQFQSWEEACSESVSILDEGDLILLDMPNVLFRQVAAGIDTWTSHVGIAFKDGNGAWIVAESTVPLLKETPLCTFLSKSSKHMFEIKRLNWALTTVEIKKVRAAAKSILNRFYNLGFDFESKRFFCSKFAYLTFRSIGVEVGHLETFRQLLKKNPRASLTFWRLWFMGSIPWNRRTVSLAS